MSNTGKYKTLSVTSPTGASVYALVMRSIDGYILDNSTGFFAKSPSAYGITLTESSTVYSATDSRSAWVDGIYSIAYYIKAGANPDVASDTLIQVTTCIVKNDVIINTEVVSSDATITHPAVVSSSTASVTISNPGTKTYDSIVCATGARILLRHQADAKQNGIYIVGATTATALVRATDMDISAELKSGEIVYVESGTIYGQKSYVLIGTDPIVLGTSEINFSGIVIGALTSAHIYVGNASGVATDVAVSGVVTLANTGATGLSLADGKVFVGNVSNVGTAVAVTGDVTLSNAGVTGLSLANGKVFVGNGSAVGTAVSISGDVTLANTGAVALVSIPSSVQDSIVRLGTLTTKLITAAGSTAGAMFNLPTSAADPTTPVEGDIWKTATAVRGFINGALVTFDVTIDTP